MNIKHSKFLIYAVLVFLAQGCAEIKKKACCMDIQKEEAPQDHEKEDGEELMDQILANTDTGGDAIVCAFTGAELAERKEALVHEIFSQVKAAEELESGYRFIFDNDERFILKLTEYIITEKACCPFFRFDLSLRSNEDVELQITGPKEAKDMITMLLTEGP